MTFERGSMDAFETEDAEHEAAVRIGQDITKFRALIRRRAQRGHSAASGARMEGDDIANPFHSTSNMVDHCFSVAQDHLEMFVDHYARGQRALRPFAMYTLIRTAIEVLAYGIWLLESDGQDERILRSLRYVYVQFASAEGLRELGGEADPDRLARQIGRLEQVRNTRPGLLGRSLSKMTSTTEVIRRADHLVEAEPLSGLRAWKMCSGIAHGEHVASLGLLERRQISDSDGRGAMFMITSSATAIALVFGAAVSYQERLELMDARYRSGG